ncbi:MAG: energy-coupling factor ABC transporter ATP-binding protein [Firmicutes bacterium]|nr:energy-coupling factor ABC transporter ATP-binding protein [Bacillota bacterium]
MASIILERVSVRYDVGTRAALGPLDLTIGEGECLFVTGPNGSGKTTLARALTGVVPLTTGHIRMSTGVDQNKWPPGTVGWVQQNPRQQMVGATVAEDIGLAPLWLGTTWDQAMKQGQASLREFGLGPWAQYKPSHLSGGWQHMAALAGVHAQDPTLLILDEPDAMLDSCGLDRLKTWVRHLKERHQTFLILGHHERWEEIADRVINLEAGRIVADETTNYRVNEGWQQFLRGWWVGTDQPTVTEVMSEICHGTLNI